MVTPLTSSEKPLSYQTMNTNTTKQVVEDFFQGLEKLSCYGEEPPSKNYQLGYLKSFLTGLAAETSGVREIMEERLEQWSQAGRV